jgi:hypothetical protein
MSSRQGMSLRILRDMCGIYATARSLGPNDEVIVAVVELSAGEGTVDVEVSGRQGMQRWYWKWTYRPQCHYYSCIAPIIPSACICARSARSMCSRGRARSRYRRSGLVRVCHHRLGAGLSVNRTHEAWCRLGIASSGRYESQCRRSVTSAGCDAWLYVAMSFGANSPGTDRTDRACYRLQMPRKQRLHVEQPRAFDCAELRCLPSAAKLTDFGARSTTSAVGAYRRP